MKRKTIAGKTMLMSCIDVPMPSFMCLNTFSCFSIDTHNLLEQTKSFRFNNSVSHVLGRIVYVVCVYVLSFNLISTFSVIFARSDIHMPTIMFACIMSKLIEYKKMCLRRFYVWIQCLNTLTITPSNHLPKSQLKY